MAATPRFDTVDAYLATVPAEVRPALDRVRALARAAVPEATECISYQLPSLRRRKVFFHYAAFKKHLGIYPPVRGDAALQADLAPYRGPKGNLQFPFAQPLPYDLIERVVRALSAEAGG